MMLKQNFILYAILLNGNLTCETNAHLYRNAITGKSISQNVP